LGYEIWCKEHKETDLKRDWPKLVEFHP